MKYSKEQRIANPLEKTIPTPFMHHPPPPPPIPYYENLDFNPYFESTLKLHYNSVLNAASASVAAEITLGLCNASSFLVGGRPVRGYEMRRRLLWSNGREVP